MPGFFFVWTMKRAKSNKHYHSNYYVTKQKKTGNQIRQRCCKKLMSRPYPFIDAFSQQSTEQKRNLHVLCYDGDTLFTVWFFFSYFVPRFQKKNFFFLKSNVDCLYKFGYPNKKCIILQISQEVDYWLSLFTKLTWLLLWNYWTKWFISCRFHKECL